MTQPNLPESSARVAASVGKATFRLPPLRDKGSSRGFGAKMISRTGSQSTIYRSVPPRPLSYTFTDILEDDFQANKSRSKTAPVSTNSPEDYAHRFKSRPTTRPKVVEFDSNCFTLNVKNRGLTGFFPSVRLKIIPPQSRSKTIELPELQLEPSKPSTRHMSTSRRLSSRSTRSSKTRKSSVRPRTKSSASEVVEENGAKENRKSPEPLVKFGDNFPFNNQLQERVPEYSDSPIVYPNIIHDANELDDLTLLPPPKKVMPRKDAPWVYRFKVKRNMNALSKIMASKPSQIAAQTSLETST